MPTDTERLLIKMEGDISQLGRQLARAEREAEKSAGKIAGSFDKANANIGRDFGRLGDTIKTALATVAVGAVVQDLTRLADTYTAITNQLRSYADILGDTDVAQQRLVDTSVGANANLEASAAVLTAAARAARDIGRSGEDVFDFTEAVGKAAAIANTGSAAVAGAITQLGQAVASPIVSLGEFGSIIEGTPRLAQAFADGIDRAGGSISTLRKLIGTQQVSGTDLFLGLLSQLPKLRQEFAAADATIADSFTNLTTRITAYVGEANQATGVTRALVPVINAVANNVEAFADAAVVALVALAGALAGVGAGALVKAVGSAATGILAQRAAAALLTTEAIKLAVAQGTLTAANIGVYSSALQGATSVNLLSGAARLGAGAMGALRVALAAVGGPMGLLGVAAALVAFNLSKTNVEMEEQARVAGAFKPILEGVKDATDKLAAAEGDYAARLKASREELFRTALAEKALEKARLQRALAAAEEARRTTVAVQGPVGEPGARAAAAGAGLARQIAADELVARARAAVQEAERQFDDVNKAINESFQVFAPKADAAVTPPGVRAIAAARTEADGAAEVARQAQDELAALGRVIAEAREEQERSAEGFLDRLPGSARAARAELAQLRRLLEEGVFARLGAEKGAAEAQVFILQEIAAASGDAAEALTELARVNGLTAEEAEAAARRIREAARDGRAERDEQLGRIFRTGEIRDDVKSALSEAFRTGDYADAFEARIREALLRASDRALDRAIDGVLDQIGAVIGGGGRGGGGAAGGVVSGVVSALGRLFGGGRVAGGPVTPGRFYTVGENGPETLVPTTPGFVIPNGAGVGGGVTLVDSRTINFTGTSGELALLEAALQRDQQSRYAQTLAIVRDAVGRRALR